MKINVDLALKVEYYESTDKEIQLKKRGARVMTQFIVGKKYTTRSICDHNCVFAYEVVKRTKCFVFLKEDNSKDIVKKKVSVIDGVETCSPCGVYSMSPTFRAIKEAEEESEIKPDEQPNVSNDTTISHCNNACAADDYRKSKQANRLRLTTYNIKFNTDIKKYKEVLSQAEAVPDNKGMVKVVTIGKSSWRARRFFYAFHFEKTNSVSVGDIQECNDGYIRRVEAIL